MKATTPRPASRRSARKRDVSLPVSETITLAGRRFVMSTRISFAQDARMMDLAEVTGLDALMVHASKSTDEESKDRAVRKLVIEGFRKGTLFDMVATALVEEGKPRWTREDADEISAMIGDLTDPTDKELITQALVGIISSFFAAARQSLANFQSSSVKAGAAEVFIHAQTEESSPADSGQES